MSNTIFGLRDNYQNDYNRCSLSDEGELLTAEDNQKIQNKCLESVFNSIDLVDLVTTGNTKPIKTGIMDCVKAGCNQGVIATIRQNKVMVGAGLLGVLGLGYLLGKGIEKNV